MIKRMLCLLFCLLIPWAALAETYIPQADESADDMTLITEDELLDRMAEVNDDSEDNSSFTVLPEDMPGKDTDCFTLLLVGSDAYNDEARG